MKEKYIALYMDFAERVAKLSHATRLKVGAVIVNDDTCVYGYNGMPAGWDNCCEHRDYMSIDAGGWIDPPEIEERWPFVDDNGRRYALKTNPEVLHAESNAIGKLARSVVNGKGADIFITHSPCIECAKLIHQSGIKRVFYKEQYRSDAGIKFLLRSDIKVEQVKRKTNEC